MNKGQQVRDSFLQEIDQAQTPGVFAMPIPEAEMQEPDIVFGMRIWLQDGTSVIGMFFEENDHEHEEGEIEYYAE